MTEAQFTELPVKKIFFKLTIPSVLSMVFMSIYMMADGIFVGRYIGADALAAVNLVMPIMSIVFALPNMLAVGSSVKVSTALGEGSPQHARHLFSASVVMVVGMGAVFTVFGTLFLKPLVFALIKDAALAQLAYDYSRIFVYGMPFIMPLFAMDNFLRACGRAKYSMAVNVAVSLLNIVLDWLFIAVLRLGIEYSAVASTVSMLVGAVFSFAPFVLKRLTLYFVKPKITKNEVIGIFYNGSSEFFSGIADSVISAVINGFLLSLGGKLAVASYSIVMYIDALLISILYGILDAVQPAVSYNYGAKEIKRSFGFFEISSIVAAGVSAVCLCVILLWPQQLAAVFSDGDAAMLDMTATALLLFSPSYLFTWYGMVVSAFLTAMDKPRESMLIMIFRAVIFPLGCLFALTPFMGVYGVFFSNTAASALTFVISLIIWKMQKREKIK